MSIADKITRLSTAKDNIATAITTKGGTVASGDGFEDFATDIASIPSGSSGTVLNIKEIMNNGGYAYVYGELTDVKEINIDLNNGTIGYYNGCQLMKPNRNCKCTLLNATNVTFNNGAFDFIQNPAGTIFEFDCGGAKAPNGNTGLGNFLRHRGGEHGNVIIRNLDISICRNYNSGSGNANSCELYPIGTCNTQSISMVGVTTFLTGASIERVIDCLGTLPEGTTYTLRIGTTGINKISASKIAEANAKGWTIA